MIWIVIFLGLVLLALYGGYMFLLKRHNIRMTWTWPWEWDWNWGKVGVYCGCLYLGGLFLHLIGFPGVIVLVLGGVIGAFAGTYEWFEL